MKSFRHALHRFFFAEEVPYGLAIVRILLPWMLMHNILTRWPWVRELYSADGAPAPLADNFGFPDFLPELPGSAAVAVYTVMACVFVTSSIGWCTRFSLIASALLYGYFGLLDCMSTITKYTVISVHMLLLLGLSDCGAVWSVDRWIRDRSAKLPRLFPNAADYRSPVWPQRLMQILLGTIYFGAAITKMHTPAFFSGDQLMYWMMTYMNNPHPLGDWMTQYQVLIVVCAYITVVWEMTFLFCVWRPWLRLPMLLIGATFHLMTWFTLGLIVFPLVMISTYFCFLTEDDMRRISYYFRDLRLWIGGMAARFNLRSVGGLAPQCRGLSWQWRSAATFALGLGVISLGAIEAEHWLDPYHLRGPEGPLPLREISQQEAFRLLGPELPLRQADKFLAFDLGTTVVGEHLLNRRSEFHAGERVIAQISLNAPHEDLWVDCNLHDLRMETEDGIERTIVGNPIIRMGQIVPRESLRSHFTMMLEEGLPAGEYFFVLRSGGEEIARKQFTLVAPLRAASAN